MRMMRTSQIDSGPPSIFYVISCCVVLGQEYGHAVLQSARMRCESERCDGKIM